MPHAIKVRLMDKDLERLKQLTEAYGVDTISQAVRILIRTSLDPDVIARMMRTVKEPTI
jgi:hypothetical protein